MKANVKSLIEKLSANGKSYSQIQNVLVTMDHAKTAKEAAEMLDELKVEKKAAGTLTDRMYAYLEEASRTQEDFYKWIDENGTKNTIRHKAAHDNVRKLANRLHEKMAALTADVEDK